MNIKKTIICVLQHALIYALLTADGAGSLRKSASRYTAALLPSNPYTCIHTKKLVINWSDIRVC